MKFPGGMNLQQMMKQAEKMQAEMAKEMEALRVDATAGGGIIKVEMNGTKEVLSIKIERTSLVPDRKSTRLNSSHSSPSRMPSSA